MEAGRELDELVAIEVMGWTKRTTELNDEQAVIVPPGWTDLSAARWWGHHLNELVPTYSTSIAAAWLVVEHMERTRPNEFMLWTEHGQWGAEFDNDISRFALTAPLAICVAARAAVGVESR